MDVAKEVLGIRRLTTKVILEMDMDPLVVAALQRRSRTSLFHIRNVIHHRGKLINARDDYHEHNSTYH